jgi:DNA-directed RNA polymerase specialized sigma24 family protein
MAKAKSNKIVTVEGSIIDVESVIKKAVHEAYIAGKAQGNQDSKDLYRVVERRLYAYPDIKDRIADDLYSAKMHSHDITRFIRGGRIPESEKEAALDMAALAARARDEAEAKEIEAALSAIQNDAYYEAVCMRYFDNAPDSDIAEYCACDERTVRRNRSRLVRKIAVRLYGADAL